MMKKRGILAIGLVALALLSSIGIAAAASANQTDHQTAPAIDTITPFHGPIGPDHSLYGLKIAFEDLDESFTVNESERLEKQVAHADNRLAELKLELAENKTDAAERALELYRQKLNQTETALALYAPNETGTPTGPAIPGLVHAREMIMKHQSVLENLLTAHPGNRGLERAYNNSLALEQKFANRLEQRMESRIGQTIELGNATQTQLENQDFGQNRTLLQNELRLHDSGMAGNSTQSDPGMNQSGGNKQPPASDKSEQNGQGTARDNTSNGQNNNSGDGNAGRNTGSGSGNTVNPGNNQNGNANNNGGVHQGTTRGTANTGGQGGNSDQKMKNR